MVYTGNDRGKLLCIINEGTSSEPTCTCTCTRTSGTKRTEADCVAGVHTTCMFDLHVTCILYAGQPVFFAGN